MVLGTDTLSERGTTGASQSGGSGRGGSTTAKRIAAYLSNPKQVFYTQALNNYLASFVANDGLQERFPGLFKDKVEVAERILQIWKEEGFIDPKELTKKIIEPFVDEPKREEKLQILSDLIDARNPKDPFTGFNQKPATPVLSGLGHMYGQLTGEPVSMIEGDFSNMSGTNLYFQSLLRATGKKDGIVVEGNKKTDEVTIVLCDIAENELKKAIKDKKRAFVHDVRSGGDEVRLIVTGLDPRSVRIILEEKVHPAIERFTAECGLHDHDYSKDPDGPRKGYGLAMAPISLAARELDVGKILKSVDIEIKWKKEVLSEHRRGILTNKEALYDQVVKYLSSEEREKRSLQQWEPNEIHSVASWIVDELENEIIRESEEFARLKSNYPENPTSSKEAAEATLALVEAVLEKYNVAAVEIDPHPFADIDVDRDLFEDPKVTRDNKLVVFLEENYQGEINDLEEAIFRRATQGYAPKDPATGLRTPRDLAIYTEIYMNDGMEQADRLLQPDLRAHMLHVEFTNVSGLNAVLGSERTNAVLEEMGTIITDTLKEYGMEQHAWSVVHKGGGTFRLLLPPYAAGLGSVDQRDVDGFFRDIERRTKDRINNKTIGEFFEGERFGWLLDERDKESIGDIRIGNIESAKERTESGEKWDTGVNLVTSNIVLDPEISGAMNIYRLDGLADKSKGEAVTRRFEKHQILELEKEQLDGIRTRRTTEEVGPGTSAQGSGQRGVREADDERRGVSTSSTGSQSKATSGWRDKLKGGVTGANEQGKDAKGPASEKILKEREEGPDKDGPQR